MSGKEEEVDGERVSSVDVVTRSGSLPIAGKNRSARYSMSLIVLMEATKTSRGGSSYICDQWRSHT